MTWNNMPNAIMIVGALACGVTAVCLGTAAIDSGAISLVAMGILLTWIFSICTWSIREDVKSNRTIHERHNADVGVLEAKAKYYGYRARLARAKADALDKDDESPGADRLKRDNEYLRLELENAALTKQVKEAKVQPKVEQEPKPE